MTDESERRARADAFEQIRQYCLDADPETAAMGRLLDAVIEDHSTWLDEERQRGTEAAHALDACIEAYLMLIHSVAQMACAPENLPKVEAYVQHKLVAAWKRQSSTGPDAN
ncbi:MAG: hypothetical protein AB7S70_15160 [Hyphomicrobium sp.]|uniref:hypothetical protein n=1 Tax=Hyphomicrobium sp. TaxID=82 RepID=UPI003D11A844